MRTISAHGAISGGTAGEWFANLGARLRRIGAAWAARRQLAREIQVLYQISDAELRDMGLSRGDLPAIRNGTYRRDS